MVAVDKKTRSRSIVLLFVNPLFQRNIAQKEVFAKLELSFFLSRSVWSNELFLMGRPEIFLGIKFTYPISGN